MIHGQHILTSFDKDLRHLNSNLIKMTELLIEELHIALSLLKNRKQPDLAESISIKEHTINLLNQETLDLCLAIFTLRSPVASDLRYVFASSNMSKILEQNGDSLKYAIKKDIPALINQDPELDEEIIVMLEHLINMHNKALNALIKKDTSLAELTTLNDTKVQQSFSNLCNLLLQKIQVEPGRLSSYYNYIFLGKGLESMAARIDNIRRFITFVETGRFDSKSSR